MSFDKYYPHKWWITKLLRYRTQRFSYGHVIKPAANYRRARGVGTFTGTLRYLHRAHRMWFNRCKELVCRDLWLPTTPDNSTAMLHRAVRYCLYCLPSQAQLERKHKVLKVQPCSQNAICPFCASRSAEDIFRRFIRARRFILRISPSAVVTYRVEKFRIPSKGLTEDGWSHSAAMTATRTLAAVLRQEQVRYKRLTKELSVHTLGSLWELIASPDGFGWQIEIRQFFISAPNARRPSSRKHKLSIVVSSSTKLREYQNAVDLLGEYVKYPSTLLTGYAELTAIVLNSRHGLRLCNGTGQLYRVGRKATEKKETRILEDVP